MLQMNNLFQKGYLFAVFLGLSAYVCGQVSGQTYTPPSYPSQPAPQRVTPPATLPPTVLPPINANSGVAAPSQVVAPPFDPFQPRTQTFPMTLGTQSSPIYRVAAPATVYHTDPRSIQPIHLWRVSQAVARDGLGLASPELGRLSE